MNNIIKIVFLVFVSITLIYSKTVKEQEQDILDRIQKNVKSTNPGVSINENNKKQNVNQTYIYKISGLLLDKQLSSKESKDQYNYASINDKNKIIRDEYLVTKKADKKEEDISDKSKEREYFQKAVTGYCRIKNEIKVEKISAYAYLDCDFTDIGKQSFAILVTPDFYSGALIGTPLHFQNKDLRTLNVSGAVLNSTKTSINIATSINDYKIEKIIANSAYNFIPKATKLAQQYLSRKELEGKKEEVVQDSNQYSSNTTKTINYESINPATYLKVAGIEILSSVFNSIVEVNRNNISYTFKIDKNSILFIDVIIDNLPNNYRGIRNTNNNLIIKQEPFIFDEKRNVNQLNNNIQITNELPSDISSSQGSNNEN